MMWKKVLTITLVLLQVHVTLADIADVTTVPHVAVTSTADAPNALPTLIAEVGTASSDFDDNDDAPTSSSVQETTPQQTSTPASTASPTSDSDEVELQATSSLVPEPTTSVEPNSSVPAEQPEPTTTVDADIPPTSTFVRDVSEPTTTEVKVEPVPTTTTEVLLATTTTEEWSDPVPTINIIVDDPVTMTDEPVPTTTSESPVVETTTTEDVVAITTTEEPVAATTTETPDVPLTTTEAVVVTTSLPIETTSSILVAPATPTTTERPMVLVVMPTNVPDKKKNETTPIITPIVNDDDEEEQDDEVDEVDENSDSKLVDTDRPLNGTVPVPVVNVQENNNATTPASRPIDEQPVRNATRTEPFVVESVLPSPVEAPKTNVTEEQQPDDTNDTADPDSLPELPPSTPSGNNIQQALAAGEIQSTDKKCNRPENEAVILMTLKHVCDEHLCKVTNCDENLKTQERKDFEGVFRKDISDALAKGSPPKLVHPDSIEILSLAGVNGETAVEFMIKEPSPQKKVEIIEALRVQVTNPTSALYYGALTRDANPETFGASWTTKSLTSADAAMTSNSNSSLIIAISVSCAAVALLGFIGVYSYYRQRNRSKLYDTNNNLPPPSQPASLYFPQESARQTADLERGDVYRASDASNYNTMTHVPQHNETYDVVTYYEEPVSADVPMQYAQETLQYPESYSEPASVENRRHSLSDNRITRNAGGFGDDTLHSDDFRLYYGLENVEEMKKRRSSLPDINVDFRDGRNTIQSGSDFLKRLRELSPEAHEDE